jgi:hypothetical protein
LAAAVRRDVAVRALEARIQSLVDVSTPDHAHCQAFIRQRDDIAGFDLMIAIAEQAGEGPPYFADSPVSQIALLRAWPDAHPLRHTHEIGKR